MLKPLDSEAMKGIWRILSIGQTVFVHVDIEHYQAEDSEFRAARSERRL